MFAQSGALAKNRLGSLLIHGLMVIAAFTALTARPVDTDTAKGDTPRMKAQTEHRAETRSAHEGHSHTAVNAAAVDAFSLGAFFGLHAVTTDNFPVEPVAQLARQIAVTLQPGVHRPIHVVSVNRRELTPLAAVSRNPSMCVVVLNTNPAGWAVWNRFFSRIDESERMNVVELAIAHEIGHCAEREISGVDQVSAGVSDPLEGEVFADIFATLYAQQYMGRRGQVALSTLRDLRDEFGRSEPTHATGERLRALQPQFEALQEQHLTPLTMAQTASHLRSSHLQ